MRRGLLVALALTALLLAGAAVFVVHRIENLVVVAVEQVGSDASGQTIVLDEAKVAFGRGVNTDLALRLFLPQGFSPVAPFKFDEVTIAFDVAAAFANPAVVYEMTVWSPHVTYRLEGGDRPPDRPAVKSVRDFVIETLRFRGGVLLVSAPGLIANDITLGLPDMEMHEVGPASDKATPGALIRQTVDRALDGLAGDGEGVAERVDRSLKEMSEMLRAQAEAWREGIGRAADKAGRAIEDLLNSE